MTELDGLKTFGKHTVTGGLSVLLMYQLLSAGIQEAKTKSDTAMVEAAEMRGEVKGMAEQLKFFMRMKGVEPLPDSVVQANTTIRVDTVHIHRPDTLGDSL